jgi:hypothetical protein
MSQIDKWDGWVQKGLKQGWPTFFKRGPKFR